MSVELRGVVSRFVPGPIREKLSKPPSQPVSSGDILGHERLFEFYGISPDVLRHGPEDKITRFSTRDGDLYIYWKERTIVPPEKYSSSQRSTT